MSPNILRRCDCCKNYHASFLINHPQHGKQYYCAKCWKAWQEQQAQAAAQTKTTPPGSA